MGLVGQGACILCFGCQNLIKAVSVVDLDNVRFEVFKVDLHGHRHQAVSLTMVIAFDTI